MSHVPGLFVGLFCWIQLVSRSLFSQIPVTWATVNRNRTVTLNEGRWEKPNFVIWSAYIQNCLNCVIHQSWSSQYHVCVVNIFFHFVSSCASWFRRLDNTGQTHRFVICAHTLYYTCLTVIYSNFEKGCRKKCMRQSPKVLWVVWSALFFKEIWKKCHGMFAMLCLRLLKESNKSRFDSCSH